MKLVKFRVTNYKSIEDSGEVDIKDFTVLVGKNESGKTNLLKALHRFNNVTNEKYTKLRGYPRTRFHEFEGKDPVVDAFFKLSDIENQELKEKLTITGVTYVNLTRRYNYSLDIKLLDDNYDIVKGIPGKELITAVDEFKIVVDSIESPVIESQTEEQLTAFKQELIDSAAKVTTDIDDDQELLHEHLRIKISNRIDQLSKILRKYITIDSDSFLNEKLKAIASIKTKIETIIKYIKENIPVFIYFETYAMLDSRIQLPNFYQRKKTGTMTPTDETANTMFELTKLDVEQVIKLGRIMTPDFGGNPQNYRQQLAKYTVENADKIREASDERTILSDRASLSLKTQLRKIWNQRENSPSFDLDGDFLRLWVTDEVSSAKIELEERSKGFQWFLSFFIVFMVESGLGHKDAILLLDEPGLNLHASAQSDLIGVLQELSQKNQLIYTTHSPFMIDTSDLSSIHVVTVDSEVGSKVSNVIWPTDKDAIFPLQSALGYSASQSLFLGKNILIVEGITDFWILESLSSYLRDTGRIGLDDDLVITPAGGAQKIAYLTSMMVSQKLNVTILADYDSAGKRLFDELVKTKILKEKHLVFVNENIGTDKNMSIEDLFPEEYYLKFVNEAYKKELKDQQITTLTSQHPMIVKRVEEELLKHDMTFYKTRPTRLVLDEFKNLDSAVPSEVLDNFELLFKLINKRRPK